MPPKARGYEPTSDTLLTLGVQPAMLTRLDGLVSKLARGDDEMLLMLGKVSRSDVTRLALIEGLKVIERRFTTRPASQLPTKAHLPERPAGQRKG